MTIDYEALAASAQTIPTLSSRTRVTKPNPFTPVVLASYNEQEPKQVGPLSTAKPDSPDGRPDNTAKSPLELVAAKVASAAQKLKKERAEAGEDISVTTRKVLIPNTETGQEEGWVQVFAQKLGGPVVATPDDSPQEPARGRRRAG